MTRMPLRFLALLVSAVVAIACASGVKRALAGDTGQDRFPKQVEIVVDTERETRGALRSSVSITYPEPKDGQIEEAQPIAAFVIDTAGRVEVPSISFVQSAPPRFRDSVCRVLRSARYEPMPAGGQPRRTLVAQPFVFSGQAGALRMGITPDDWNRRVSTMSREDLFAYLNKLPHCQ